MCYIDSIVYDNFVSLTTVIIEKNLATLIFLWELLKLIFNIFMRLKMLKRTIIYIMYIFILQLYFKQY